MCACGTCNQCVLIYPRSHARVHCPVAPPLTETKCSGGDVDTMQVHEDDRCKMKMMTASRCKHSSRYMGAIR